MGETYEAAGVNINAGEEAVNRIKDRVRSTFRREVIGDIGGFGGLFAIDWKRYREPLLVASTDGVGTKSAIARLAGRRSTIGIDCVAMSVDDIAAQGAEPLFFLDYISVGALVPEEIARTTTLRVSVWPARPGASVSEAEIAAAFPDART